MTIRFFTFIVLLLNLSFVSAQQQNIQEIRKQLKKLNTAFDSSYFLSFKVQYLYHSVDSVSGQEEKSQKEANYTVKGKNFFYSLGNMEYMQNDSMAFTVSHQNKSIFLSKTKETGVAKSFGLNAITDSTIGRYAQFYTITGTVDSLHNKAVLNFTALPGATVVYKKMIVSFNLSPAILTKVEIAFNEPGEIKLIDSSGFFRGNTKKVLLSKNMQMLFSNYRPSDTNPDLFKPQHYVFYDRLLNRFMPMEKYRQYKLYINGVNQAK